jgi:predicted glycoside hydrolase/deacetylase ChbG (UPF0249 family)
MPSDGSDGRIRVVVQGDDFGMCHAVNDGIAQAATEGILTQASVMAACPWVDEAAEIARRIRLRTGLHQTLTCDWGRLRWPPLTGGASLRGPDGTFPNTVAAARSCRVEEAVTELMAQAERAQTLGLHLDYLDVHMGMVCPPAYEEVAETMDLPFLYPGLKRSLTFASIGGLSERPAEAKKSWLLGWLERRGPGDHLLVSHPAVDSAELRAMSGPDERLVAWSVTYRLSDLDVLTDPDVRAAVDSLGIELTTVSELAGTAGTTP